VTRGTRPKKPSSSRGFACEARGGRGFWGLKTENCKFFSLFPSRQQLPKKILKKIYLFLIFISASARIAEGREGEGGGREREGREMRPRGRPCPRGCWAASARTHGRVHADAPCFTPGNFKKDAIVRPSHGRPHGHRPIVRKRPRGNPV
jgi:hypothetical protein